MPDTIIHALDGTSFPAYSALPEGGNGAGLIIIHDVLGLSSSARALCDRYAALGYIVLCPDLYARQLGDSALGNGDMDYEQASKLYKSFDVEAGVRDLLAALAHVRSSSGCGGKVGALGYCLGGRMAFLMSSRSDVDCAVGYDNVGIENMLDEVYDIRMPSLFHFGEADRLMPQSSRQKVLNTLSRNGKIVAHLYEGAEHGFSVKSCAHFHPEQAALAQSRTDDFLAEHLKG